MFKRWAAAGERSGWASSDVGLVQTWRRCSTKSLHHFVLSPSISGTMLAGASSRPYSSPKGFSPSGVPLTVYEGREGRALLYATGTAEPRQERLTLVINGQTASSAELFAGILQWHHRAELVGSPTVGKRTVQRVARLDQQHLLFLTTGRFLAPDGTLGVNGLTPDRLSRATTCVASWLRAGIPRLPGRKDGTHKARAWLRLSLLHLKRGAFLGRFFRLS